MVEENPKLQVFIASPPTVFDAAVILRTLYTGLGVDKWRAYIVGLGSTVTPRLLLESRLPISVAKQHIAMDAPDLKDTEAVAVVNPRGQPAWSIEARPEMLVIDYAGFYTHSLQRAIHVKGLGLPLLTYEAIAVIYEFYIRRNIRENNCSKAFSLDPKKGLYIARKALEALTLLDNYPVLEPNTLIYALRRVYLSEGYILDPTGYHFEINPISGKILEIIEATAYVRKRGLRKRGIVRIVFNGEELRVSDWRGEIYRIVLDYNHDMACAAPGLIASKEPKGEEVHGVSIVLNTP